MRLAVAFVVLAGCSGSSPRLQPDAAAPDSATVRMDAPPPSPDTAASDFDAGPAVPCPADQPPAGAPCAHPDQRCTYGEQVRPVCRRLLICTAGSWKDQPTKPDCAAPPPTACPAAIVADGPCSVESAHLCEVPAGGQVCVCGLERGERNWSCENFGSVMPDCPRIAPNEGTPCVSHRTRCEYGACGRDLMPVFASCEGDVWVWRRARCLI